jgi:hypothetical protein
MRIALSTLSAKVRKIKSTRELANELVADGILRCDQILEMKYLYPGWLLALYVRVVHLGGTFGCYTKQGRV